MNCPVCNTDSIPFYKTWLKSGYGSYNCDQCGATLKIKKNLFLVLMSLTLGASAGGLGLYFHSWGIFAIALLVAIAFDALIDIKFRRLIECPIKKVNR